MAKQLSFKPLGGRVLVEPIEQGLATNLALAVGLGPAVFWMWWNITGLVVAVAVTWLASRLMVPPAPATATTRAIASPWM